MSRFCYRRVADLLQGIRQSVSCSTSRFLGGAMKNQNSVGASALLVLVSLLGTSSGCAVLSGVSNGCACATDCCNGCQCHSCEPGCGYSDVGCPDFCRGGGCVPGCLGAGCCPLALGHHHKRIEVGPPAVRYQPEMPPEFFPVPVTPVIANVNPDAPPNLRGSVEVDWAPPCQLTIYGRD